MTAAAPTKSDTVRSRLLIGLLLSIVAIVVAMIATEWWPSAKRRQLGSKIEKAGGKVVYSDQHEQPKEAGFVRRLLQTFLGYSYFAEVDAISLTPRSSDDAQLILAFPNLRSLTLNGATVSDEFLVKLNGLKELNELSLENFKLGDQAKDALQQHPGLITLRLEQCSLSSPLLNAIRGINGIFSLTFEQCTAQDGWQALCGAQSNLDLNISQQALSEPDILALHAANPGWRIRFAPQKDKSDPSMGDINLLPSVNELSQTTHLRFQGPNVTEATLAALKLASELTSLDLGGCQISDKGMQVLQQFPKLTSLSTSDIPISDNGIQVVQYLPNLTRLSILDAPITDKGAQHFAVLTKLEFLQLERTRIAGTTLGELSPSLKNLGLHTSEITDAGVASISQLASLEVLSLGSQRITDACMNDLSKLKSLKVVEFYQTPLSATALDRLKASIPGCTVNAY